MYLQRHYVINVVQIRLILLPLFYETQSKGKHRKLTTNPPKQLNRISLWKCDHNDLIFCCGCSCPGHCCEFSWKRFVKGITLSYLQKSRVFSRVLHRTEEFHFETIIIVERKPYLWHKIWSDLLKDRTCRLMIKILM